MKNKYISTQSNELMTYFNQKDPTLILADTLAGFFCFEI